MLTRSKVKGPLPGGCQGAARAGASCDSMRDASGRELIRRASAGTLVEGQEEMPVPTASCPEETTAETQNGSNQHLTAAATDERVSSPSGEATASDGTGSRRRRKWTYDINHTIMRIYYQLTKGETDKTLYRQKVYAEVIKQIPELANVTEQRIADQIRTIKVKNLLPMQTLEQMKQDSIQQAKRANVVDHGRQLEDGQETSGMAVSENNAEDDGTPVQESADGNPVVHSIIV
jgi:hypothetical protein